MKKLLRLIAVTLFLVVTFSFASCSTGLELKDYVSDLRHGLYYGEGEKYSLKIAVGEKETPLQNDGAVGQIQPYVKIVLYGGEVGVSYTVGFRFNDQDYLLETDVNPATSLPTIEEQIENFNADNLTFTVMASSYSENVTTRNIVPQGTIDYLTALDFFKNQQPTFIENHTENEKLTVELYVKVLVEQDKAYWYIGVLDGQKIRAMLIDGITGELLATKDVY